jgi:formate dehydrogenase iron-sulfur subunit
MLACPFDIPKYEWESPSPIIRKCIMCFDKRIKEGKKPACVSVCPTGATKFGDRDDLIREARTRIEAHPDRYVDHIYGLHEAGGTSVIYISPVPFSELGFKTELSDEPYPKLVWDVLSKVPNIVGVGGVLLVGIHWIINRRMTMEKLNNQNATSSDDFADESNTPDKEPEK